MSSRLLATFLVLSCLFFLFPTAAHADGIIIPDPPPGPIIEPFPIAQLQIRYHRVDITITDQIVITHVDQVFYNPNLWQVEGNYIFPIPKGAVVSAFTLWVDGKAIPAEIMDAEKARQTYEDIVRDLRDPALLEYADQSAVRARIFPIPPGGERRIELEYTQTLTADNGLIRYLYPLSTEKFSTQPLEEVTISVDIRSRQAIRAVYSPSHKISLDRQSENHVRAGYEANNITPDADFALYYSLGETEALHLLSYRDPKDPQDSDGFFLLLLAPRPDAQLTTLPKDVLLVLDRSGSMDGEKFIQAQQALRYVLKHLNPEDRFNIIAFSTGLEIYAQRENKTMVPASEANEAIAWVDRLSAEGSTDINRALLEAVAMADNQRPTYLIFLTDGLPTEGVIDSQDILDNLERAIEGRRNLRLFAFGVGYDVDTFLLDSLSQAHHGASNYVLPDERLDEVLSAFYTKISTPVLTDLIIDFGDITAYDIYPSPLPDLFVGSQVVVVGRYRHGGTTTVTLSGKINQETQTFKFPEQVFAGDSRATSDALQALPRLWATRKVGHLLNQIRLHGADQETIDQIVRLSVRYGIVTPYTSYLVTEPQPLGSEGMQRIAADQYNQMQAMPTAMPYGQAAVEKAAEQGDMSQAQEVPAPPAEVADVIKILASRTFIHQNGVWIDTAFDPDTMKTVPVPFLSADYFALTKARPELADAFALGERVIAFSDGVAYEVVSADAQSAPLEIPSTYAPAPEEISSGSEEPLTSPQPVGVHPDAGGQPTPQQPVSTSDGKGTICVSALLIILLIFWGMLALSRFYR